VRFIRANIVIEPPQMGLDHTNTYINRRKRPKRYKRHIGILLLIIFHHGLWVVRVLYYYAQLEI
jgi:hypothetical protein